MNNFDSWCKTVSVVALASGVIMSVVPKSRLSSSLKTLSVIIVIYAFVVPLSDFDSDYIFNVKSEGITDNISLSENSASEIIIEIAEDKLKQTVNDLLAKNDYNGECTVKINNNNGTAEIEVILITGIFSDEEKDNICRLINSVLDQSINIEFSG